MKHWVEHRDDLWLPTWELVIGNLDACPEDVVYLMDNLGAVAPHVALKQYEPILSVAEQLSKEYNDAPVTAQTMISFTSRSSTYGKHVDDVDVYILQALGILEIIVWEDEQEHVYQLKPGDMIHIPAGLYHSTKPLSPRVSISYGIEI
jgi:ribosomal protein L16 Arg81 hydroxylase